MFNNYFIFLILPLSIFVFSLTTNRLLRGVDDIKTERNANVDGLRGILAVTVFFYHFILLYNWIVTGKWGGVALDPINNLGSIPVSMFFMITGYLFFGKIISKKEINWSDLYISRVMRIYPVYLVGVFFVFISYFIFSRNATSINVISSFVRWLLFQGYNIGDFDAKRVIAGVQWTLVYEAIFYASLPIWFTLYRHKYSMKGVLLSLTSLLVVIAYSLSYPVEYEKLFIFAFGAIPHLVNKSNAITRFARSLTASALSVSLLFLALFLTTQYSFTQEILVGIVFVLICCGNGLFYILTTKTIYLLGKISYCVYIIHGVFLFIVFKIASASSTTMVEYKYFMLMFPLTYVIVVFSALYIHKEIELKGVSIGKRLISGREKQCESR